MSIKLAVAGSVMAGLVAVGGVAGASTWQPAPARQGVEFVQPAADTSTPTAETPPVVPTVDPTAEPEPEVAVDTTPNATDVAPVWHQATCELPDGSVDIPAVDGVQYDLDVIPGPAGNYSLGVGDHTVTVFGSDRAPTWTFTVDTPTEC